ncbi:glutathione synthase [Vitreimonas flagellata]|uniref:glutathione synthase n=1 Tax=Vitreimonas flagellata TaxID=2560861 RepID=UPI00142FB42F|nr:glutathione synthase [Vitreimonas flagellata]
MKSLRIAVQMDPIETMVVQRDTSLALMIEAQNRGHETWWFTPNDVFFDAGVVKARARRASVSLNEAKHYENLETAIRALDDFDVILIRQDPPFDMGYVSNTYFLELTKARVLNPPRAVRNISEKMSIMYFPELTPKTWVGRDLDALVDFAKRFDQVVLKVLYLMGGDGVIKLKSSDPDFRARAGKFMDAAGREPILAQEFMPAVSGGDKRLFVLDGEPFGAIRRMPQGGDFRANLHAGGIAEPAEVDENDRRIAAAVAPLLKQEGILFAGLDVIAGKLIEINVTSPTLVQELKRFTGLDLPKAFWDKVEGLA